MEEFVRKNPWLGLESYKEGEILYGRDDDIRDLSQCVLNDTATLLYGKSGIGKSSLLNAGILPAARRHGYLPVLIRLSHKEKHSYLHQINQAILNAILHSLTGEFGTDVSITNRDHVLNDAQSLIREVVSCKDTEAESFYEYFHRHTFHNANGDRLKLLIIFDQFEEIFTLQEDIQKKKTFFTHLADLLNDIMPDELQQKVEISSDTQEEIIVGGESNFENIFDDLNLGVENSLPEYVTDNDVHFVFTIREDFLSEFEYYSAAIPSLKQNRYGLRPINEEQAAQIILRPIPELIDESVAKLIIEKITGKKDFKIDGVPEIEVDSAVLSLYLNRLYETTEGKTITKELVEQKDGKIISDFYNDALSDISDSTIEYLEDKLLNGQGRRDNITVYDAINKGNISEQELDILCNKKKILRQFNYAGDIRIEFVHDKLCSTVARHRIERLDRIEKEAQNKKLKQLRRQRSMTLLGLLALISAIAYVYIGYFMPIQYRYANVAKKWSCFEGVEPLTKAEASYRNYHYILKKRGFFTEGYSSMECRDRFDSLCTNHSLSNYLVVGTMDPEVFTDSIMYEKLQTTCKWELIPDPADRDSVNKRRVIQERGYDRKGNLVYALNYSDPKKPSTVYDDSYKRIVIGSYVDEQGLPLEILKDGYRFFRITYDDNGRDMLIEYFDWEGNPSTNSDGAYQAFFEYNDDGLMTSSSSLNMYGKRMIDAAGNCGMIAKYDGYRLLEHLSVDEFGREKAMVNGYSRVTYEYDEHGRPTKRVFWNYDKPIQQEHRYHINETVYDDSNNTIIERYYNSNVELIHSYEMRFDDKGNLLYESVKNNTQTVVRESRYDKGNECIDQTETTIDESDTTGVFVYKKDGNIETRKWSGKLYGEKELIRKTIYDDKDRIVEVRYYPHEDNEVLYRLINIYTDSGHKKDDIFYYETDSSLYYIVDSLVKIKVSLRKPNWNRLEERIYIPGDPEPNGAEYIVDMYGNRVEDLFGTLKKWYNFVNARTAKENGNFIGRLTRYKFPCDNSRHVYFNQAKDRLYACDEDGNEVSEQYTLPTIYSGKREYKTVFVEYRKYDKIWHGVILESSSGIRYGDQNYDCQNFEFEDSITYLNLTTMRVETDCRNKNGFLPLTFYNCSTTKEEFELYKEHYTKYLEQQYANASN